MTDYYKAQYERVMRLADGPVCCQNSDKECSEFRDKAQRALKFSKPEIERLIQGPNTAAQRERLFQCLIYIDEVIKP